MTPEELAAIKARAEAATAGPWNIRCDGWQVVAPNCNICAAQNYTHRIQMNDGGRSDGTYPAEPDAAFIASARSDVPALVAEVERLRAELETMTRDRNYHRNRANYIAAAKRED